MLFGLNLISFDLKLRNVLEYRIFDEKIIVGYSC